jgi:glycerophosphoryl diester phosphodiesterase
MNFRLMIVTLFCSSPTSVWAQSDFPFFESVQPARRIQVMAHRGLHTLAPENSVPAVLACHSDFVEWAEIDVQLTKDGQHVVIHNSTVDAVTDGTGRVADLTLEEVQRLDAGAWFAPRFKGLRLQSLPEMLAAAKGKVNVYLDCKHVDPRLLVREIRAAQMESQVVVYAGLEVLAKVRAEAGDSVATMAKFRPKTMEFGTFVSEVDPAAVEIDADEVTLEICCAFHHAGIKVQAQVLGAELDNPTTWAKMIEAGVDWFQTDDPVGVRFHEVRRRIPRFPVQFACHRGASRYAPENSLAAIRLAAALGADYIEIDIRTTQDGRFVLLHDRTLNRTTNGTGPVSDQSLDVVTQLDAGAWFGKPFVGTRVPHLEDGLTALGHHSRAYLDAKDIPPAALLEAIKRHDLMNRHVVYQSLDYCRKLKALDSSVRLLPPLKKLEDFDDVAEVKPFGVDASWTILSKELIDRCHTAGIQVFSDALGLHETVEEYRKAMGWGIDVIQTDHPLRVLRAIELGLVADN